MESHIRIDEGQKRGPRKKAPPPNARHPVTQRYLARFTPEQRQAIISDALESLVHGEPTDQIAKRHGCDGGLLRTWLLVDDAANQARSIYFAQQLDEARTAIQEAADPLTLARAREEFRSIAWLAERRNSAHWGQHNMVTVEHVTDLGERLRRANERVIEHDAVPQIGRNQPETGEKDVTP